VILTACTTGIGFGSLLLARHRGLQSLGAIMAIGSLACMMASVVLLPGMLTLGRVRGNETLRTSSDPPS
jgi:predicted RND superfamily exporter protein